MTYHTTYPKIGHRGFIDFELWQILGLKSMAQVLKPTPVAQVDANSRTPAHSGGTSRLRSQS
jgi:hypothetical protein